MQNILIHLKTNQHSWYLLLYPSKGSVLEIPSWSRVNNSKINLSTNINGYLHFTVLLWKVTLWFATSCFSVDTPVYRIQYPDDNKLMPFSWFKRPHVAVIKSVVFWSSSSTHVVILRRWQKPRNIFVTETFVIVVRNLYLSKSSKSLKQTTAMILPM